MAVRELIGLLLADGWERIGPRGGVVQWRHPWKPGRATVACSPGEELGREGMARLLRHVGLEATATAAPRRAPLATAEERRDEVLRPDRAGGTPLVRLGP